MRMTVWRIGMLVRRSPPAAWMRCTRVKLPLEPLAAAGRLLHTAADCGAGRRARGAASARVGAPGAELKGQLAGSCGPAPLPAPPPSHARFAQRQGALGPRTSQPAGHLRQVVKERRRGAVVADESQPQPQVARAAARAGAAVPQHGARLLQRRHRRGVERARRLRGGRGKRAAGERAPWPPATPAAAPPSRPSPSQPFPTAPTAFPPWCPSAAPARPPGTAPALRPPSLPRAPSSPGPRPTHIPHPPAAPARPPGTAPASRPW
jgi:hypothetical protein